MRPQITFLRVGHPRSVDRLCPDVSHGPTEDAACVLGSSLVSGLLYGFRNAGARIKPQTDLTESVYKVVLQMSIPAQIRQLIFRYY